MAVFKGGWILLIPDAEPAKHRAEIKSDKYEATIVFVKDANQAIEVCQELVQKEGIQSLSLCPAFTHGDVAKIGAAVKGTPINICRSDGPGFLQEFELIKKAGWF